MAVDGQRWESLTRHGVGTEAQFSKTTGATLEGRGQMGPADNGCTYLHLHLKTYASLHLPMWSIPVHYRKFPIKAINRKHTSSPMLAV